MPLLFSKRATAEESWTTLPELGTCGHRQNVACLAALAGTAALYSCDLRVTQTQTQIYATLHMLC